MIRFNMMIESELLEKLREESKKRGFGSVSSFIRYILIKFFENK
jgi:metal-responsive CopG/Arc/MetJ family transcriptional regulator